MSISVEDTWGCIDISTVNSSDNAGNDGWLFQVECYAGIRKAGTMKGNTHD